MQWFPTPTDDAATLATAPTHVNDSETFSMAIPQHETTNQDYNAPVTFGASVFGQTLRTNAMTDCTYWTNGNSLNTWSAPATFSVFPGAMQMFPTPAPRTKAASVSTPTDNVELVKYPPNAGNREIISIVFKDMQRLAHRKMLNDQIVEFGIKYILYDLHKERKDKIHSMSTYFYSKFAANAPDDKMGYYFTPNNADMRKALLAKNYMQVRKWTRKVDIFDKDFIVIPVNDELHWHLIIVAYSERALRKKDEPEGGAPTDPKEMCQVYVFDSLPDSEDPKRCCAYPLIRDYLRLEFEDKKAKKDPNLRFSEKHVCSIRVKNLPQQPNLADCGLYLVANLEAFLANIPTIGQDFLRVLQRQTNRKNPKKYEEKSLEHVHRQRDQEF